MTRETEVRVDLDLIYEDSIHTQAAEGSLDVLRSSTKRPKKQRGLSTKQKKANLSNQVANRCMLSS